MSMAGTTLSFTNTATELDTNFPFDVTAITI